MMMRTAPMSPCPCSHLTTGPASCTAMPTILSTFVIFWDVYNIPTVPQACTKSWIIFCARPSSNRLLFSYITTTHRVIGIGVTNFFSTLLADTLTIIEIRKKRRAYSMIRFGDSTSNLAKVVKINVSLQQSVPCFRVHTVISA
jgi:hypothetical protein